MADRPVSVATLCEVLGRLYDATVTLLGAAEGLEFEGEEDNEMHAMVLERVRLDLGPALLAVVHEGITHRLNQPDPEEVPT